MTPSRFSRIISTALALLLAVLFALSVTAPDTQTAVVAENHRDEHENTAMTSSSEASDRPTHPDARSLVDIYCSQSARDAFSDEDLEFLLDLVVYKLEPQAVELLLNSFPALRIAADQGLIGREIGLYVYCITGDEDGVPEHANVPSYALAYVGSDTVAHDGDISYCYMLGIDVSGLAKRDGDDFIRDPTTGKLVLEREGESMIELENTLVHELFHAIMADYNRPGIGGGRRGHRADRRANRGDCGRWL